MGSLLLVIAAGDSHWESDGLCACCNSHWRLTHRESDGLCACCNSHMRLTHRESDGPPLLSMVLIWSSLPGMAELALYADSCLSWRDHRHIPYSACVMDRAKDCTGQITGMSLTLVFIHHYMEKTEQEGMLIILSS